MVFDKNKTYSGQQVRCYENNGHWYATEAGVLDVYYDVFNYSFDELPKDDRSGIIEDLTEAYDNDPQLVFGFINWVTDSDHYLTIFQNSEIATKDFTLVTKENASKYFIEQIIAKRQLRIYLRNLLSEKDKSISIEKRNGIVGQELLRIKDRIEWNKNWSLIGWDKEKRQFYIDK